MPVIHGTRRSARGHQITDDPGAYFGGFLPRQKGQWTCVWRRPNQVGVITLPIGNRWWGWHRYGGHRTRRAEPGSRIMVRPCNRLEVG
jgi:hypothetical protein